MLLPVWRNDIQSDGGSAEEEAEFNWEEYMEESGTSAAPHTAFKHVSWGGIIMVGGAGRLIAHATHLFNAGSFVYLSFWYRETVLPFWAFVLRGLLGVVVLKLCSFGFWQSKIFFALYVGYYGMPRTLVLGIVASHTPPSSILTTVYRRMEKQTRHFLFCYKM